MRFRDFARVLENLGVKEAVIRQFNSLRVQQFKIVLGFESSRFLQFEREFDRSRDQEFKILIV